MLNPIMLKATDANGKVLIIADDGALQAREATGGDNVKLFQDAVAEEVIEF